MCWLLRFSLRNLSNCFCSTRARGQGQGEDLGDEVVGIQYEVNGMVPLLPIGQFIK